ncbi:MAG: hypothetical protein IPM53_00690 [Anaerolineaceae bacterium]|nr:hypothetical protein [Anaerolineaceae bacterium]
MLLLVIISFVVVLRRPQPTYRPDDTPEGVVHNYLLALRQGEYERAYRYLSPDLVNYPASAAEFSDDIAQYRWEFRLDEDVTLLVESGQINGRQATAVVQETSFYNSGLFNNNQYTRQFTMTLERSGDRWLIIEAESYLLYCWTHEDGCE